MRTVHQWFLTRGSHLLLTYGQDDPWSAQRFYLGSGTTDSAIFTIKGGNHVTPFTALPPVQQKTFVDMLRTWAGLSDATGPVQTASPNRVPLATLIGGRH
jgi:hypothetical protein